jgi:glycosyltransferase involved in cell wall biosynthesis
MPAPIDVVIAPMVGIDVSGFERAVRSSFDGDRVMTLKSDFEDFVSCPHEVDLTGFGWSRLLVALDPERLAFVRGLHASIALLDGGSAKVVILVAGESIILNRLDSLADADAPLTLVHRTPALFVHDGMEPTNIALVNEGAFCPLALAVSNGGQKLVRDVIDLILTNPELRIGQVLELAIRNPGVSAIDDPAIAVGWWRAPQMTMSLIDLTDFSPTRPWMLRDTNSPARVRLSNEPDLAMCIESNLDQLGSPAAIALPSGLLVDEPMREITSIAVATYFTSPSDSFPDPFSNDAEFVAWANERPSTMPGASRHLDATYRHRSDLRLAYPEAVFGNVDRLIEWSFHRSTLERRAQSSVMPAPPQRPSITPRADRRQRGGLNLIGYLDRASGLGAAARSLSKLLQSAGISVSHVTLPNSESPVIDDYPHIEQELRYRTNLIVATAEQTELLEPQLGVDLFSGRRNIGYWFWELSKPSELAIAASQRFDEVWTPSKFVHDSFAGHLRCPVHLAPLPFPEVTVAPIDRISLGLPAERFIFLTAFDLLSAIDRKNPFAAIDAFTQAFSENEGPLLVIKTINGDRRWEDIDRIHASIDKRSDIMLIDRSMEIDELHGMIELSDCFISLHRSEGLGLHLHEAISLGTPVITTAYSGPLDFLDEATASLIPYKLVPVELGGVYPGGCEWAEADIPTASQEMRRLFEDPAYRISLEDAGRQRVSTLRRSIDLERRIKKLLR